MMCASVVSNQRAEQVSGGVFIIGLALMFMGTLPWWPGILLVIGASSLARGLAEGQRWYSVQGALWMIGLGLLFWTGFSFPLLLIVIGLSMLFGFVFRPPMFRGGRADEDDSIPARGYSLEDAEVDDTDYAAYAEKPKRKRKNEDGLEYYDEDDLR
jgi:hypothetical protein